MSEDWLSWTTSICCGFFLCAQRVSTTEKQRRQPIRLLCLAWSLSSVALNTAEAGQEHQSPHNDIANCLYNSTRSNLTKASPNIIQRPTIRDPNDSLNSLQQTDWVSKSNNEHQFILRWRQLINKWIMSSKVTANLSKDLDQYKFGTKKCRIIATITIIMMPSTRRLQSLRNYSSPHHNGYSVERKMLTTLSRHGMGGYGAPNHVLAKFEVSNFPLNRLHFREVFNFLAKQKLLKTNKNNKKYNKLREGFDRSSLCVCVCAGCGACQEI